MKKMLKRADGSTSQRGLWDNIRDKAASNKKAGKKGKAPSKDMLEQEKKIKAESKKMGGDWMQDSNKLKFGGITKYQSAGFDKSCISGDCNKMMAETGQNQGGKGTGYEGTGAGFNATKNRYNLNIVEKSQDQLDKEEAARNAAKGKADMKQAGRQMTRDENLAILREAQTKAEMKAKFAGASGVYANPRDLSPTRINKTGGKKSSWLEESKELKFGGLSKKKYQTAGPKMDTKTAVGQVFQGKMTAAEGQAAIGKTPKPAMTPEQKTEFMSKLKTYGKKTGGKRKMGGKNC